MLNVYVYIANVFKDALFKEATENVYEVVSSEPYSDKKGKLQDGFRCVLRILKDNHDYGTNKETGEKRQDNVGQNFDVTILSRDVEPKRGDIVRLGEFDEDNSYVIDFNLILRYKSVEIVKTKEQRQQAVQQKKASN